MHHGPSPQLGCFLVKHRKQHQSSVKRGHISKTSYNKWKHHTTHPFCTTFYAFESLLFYNHPNHEGNVIVIPSTMGPIKVITWEGHYSL
jgi:hypothetical protein